MNGRRSAVTLVEVLVTIGIIGVVVGLILPAVSSSRAAAARLQCMNNLKQVGVALHHYHNSNNCLPPRPPLTKANGDPNAILGWMALILPYVEQGELYRISEQACQSDPNPLHSPPHIGLKSVIKMYVCPSDGRLTAPLTDPYGVSASFTSYIGIAGVVPPGATRGLKGPLGGRVGSRFSAITDGLSQTIMVGERPPPDSLQAGWWYPRTYAYSNPERGPNNGIHLGGVLPTADIACDGIKGTFGPGRLSNPCDRFHLWSLHLGGANFLMADGSVRYLPYTSAAVVVALASQAGGEVVDLAE